MDIKKQGDQGLFLWYLVINLNFSNGSGIVSDRMDEPEKLSTALSVQSPTPGVSMASVLQLPYYRSKNLYHR